MNTTKHTGIAPECAEDRAELDMDERGYEGAVDTVERRGHDSGKSGTEDLSIMKTKLEQLKEFASSGDWNEAIRIAAKFDDLGDDKAVITRAWAAIQNPRFYRQIQIDPDAAVAAGIEAIKKRNSL